MHGATMDGGWCFRDGSLEMCDRSWMERHRGEGGKGEGGIIWCGYTRYPILLRLPFSSPKSPLKLLPPAGTRAVPYPSIYVEISNWKETFPLSSLFPRPCTARTIELWAHLKCEWEKSQLRYATLLSEIRDEHKIFKYVFCFPAVILVEIESEKIPRCSFVLKGAKHVFSMSSSISKVSLLIWKVSRTRLGRHLRAPWVYRLPWRTEWGILFLF